MKFDVEDKNRCRLVCVKFHLNRCRFAAAVAKCLGGSLFWGHSVVQIFDTWWLSNRKGIHPVLLMPVLLMLIGSHPEQVKKES